MMTSAYVFLADGFEEIEAITPIDLLRRAGVEVTTISIGDSLEVKGSHGVTVIADRLFSGVETSPLPSAVVLPGGGEGAKNLANHEGLVSLIKKQFSEGALVAAICASPAVVLSKCGVLEGKNWTCYPGMEKDLSCGTHRPERVVCDGNLITSRGAGTAIEFSLALIERLVSKAASEKIRAAIVAQAG